MVHRARRALPVIAVVVVAVGLATADSLANRLATSRLWRATWITLTFETGNFAVRCEVTLEGSFHSREFSKVVISLIGYITRMAVAENLCVGGRVTPLLERLPWHMRYERFEGTLPNITGIYYNSGIAFNVATSLLPNCLYGTANGKPVWKIAREPATEEATALIPQEAIDIPLVSGFGCPERVRLRGASTTYTLLGTTERIKIILIQ
jgi:hypothetical protein